MAAGLKEAMQEAERGLASLWDPPKPDPDTKVWCKHFVWGESAGSPVKEEGRCDWTGRKPVEGGLMSCDQRGNWDAVLLQTLPEADGTQLRIVPLRGVEAEVEGRSWGLNCSSFPAVRCRKPSTGAVTLCREWGFLQGQRAGPTQHQRLLIRTKVNGCWTCWTEQGGF